MDKYGSNADVKNAISNIRFSSGGTDTAGAIKFMREQSFNPGNGARSGIPQIGIVITDGKSMSKTKTIQEAEYARQQGITMFAVGIGSGVDANELNGIGNDPNDQHVFSVGSFDGLQAIKSKLAVKACEEKPTAPPTTPDPNRCRDLLPNCADYGTGGCEGSFKAWATKNCPVFCGFCPPGPSVPPVITIKPPDICADKINNCQSYGADFCTDYKDFASDKCPKYCGFCSLTNTLTGGYFNKCYYKGNAYNTGETWKDGCDSECSCDDGRQGLYRCYSLCPVYYNLPKECVLTAVPGQCCKQPVCDFGKKITTTTGYGHGKNNGLDVCVYDGQNYYQGQSWQDGCSVECTCVDAKTGLYSCQSLCPVYNNLPAECKMVSKAGKCCQEVYCEWGKQITSVTGTGHVTGTGTLITKPEPPRICTDKKTNCAAYGKGICSDPTYVSWAGDNCAKFCNLCSFIEDKCIFQGRQYSQDQKWTNGCEECVCDDARNGFYRCTDKCPVYHNIPAQCREVSKTGQCCKQLECDYGTFIPSKVGTITPPTTTPGKGQVVIPGTGIVITGNTTPPPGTVITGTTQKIEGCLYKGQVYVQNQRWQDGCDYMCECIDGKSGQYSCGAKCPIWNNLPSNCKLSDIVGDPCCQYPECTGTVVPGTIIPVYGKGISGYGLVTSTSTGTIGPVPTLKPGIGTVVTAPPVAKDICTYKAKQYKQGEKWDDGCSYKCECKDASIGFYECEDRCQSYVNLPSYCVLVTDPKDPCCKVPNCSFPTAAPPTPIPPRVSDTCLHNGKYYTMGQEWEDGCALRCRCEDGKTGYYRCNNRCPSYTSIPSGCKLVADPKDPACCTVPQCDITATVTGTVKPGTTQIVTPQGFIGTFTGTGKPQITTNTGTIGATKDVCIYGDKVYRQGERWNDGCQYDCECIDATKGQYRCQDKCPRYPTLPANCKLVIDPFDSCCQKAQCTVTVTGTGTTGECKDVLPNCAAYGSAACGPVFGDWGSKNCAKTCGLCSPATTTLVPPTRTVRPTVPLPADCQDTLSNCADYGSYSCQGDYIPWAINNCVRTCNLCHLRTTATVKPTAPVTSDFCVYKGTNYKQSATWDDGCQYTCTCENAKTGSWKCYEKCPVFKNLPSACRMNPPLPGNCCGYPSCPDGYTIIYPKGVRPETGVNLGKTGGVSVPGTGTVITGIGSVTNKPVTVTVTPPVVNSDYCVYKGTNYKQSATWDDGCQYTCTCENAKIGSWKCYEKCPVFYNLPSACSMNPPLPGNCCGYPSCPDGYTVIYPKGVRPETGVNLGKTGGVSVPGTGTVITGIGSVTNKPATVTVTPPVVTSDYCVYKGTNYKQSATWDDGCQYSCTCENAKTGSWKCYEKCPVWNNLPSGCRLNPPIPGKCCAYPTCPDGYTIIYPNGYKVETGVNLGKPGGISVTGTGNYITGIGSVTNRPVVITPTTSPVVVNDYCVYKGKNYKQSATWDDGCQYTCTCENAKTGTWKCYEKCPAWNNLHSACRLNPPLPGNCCAYPSCPAGYTIVYPNGYKVEPGVNLGTTGGTSVVGTGNNAITGKGNNIITQPTGGCRYTDGKIYKVGEAWADGCKYYCTCKDAAGNYECQQRCLQWNLPAECNLDAPISGFCCAMPRCPSNYKINFPVGYEKETGFYVDGSRYTGTGTGGTGTGTGTSGVTGSMSKKTAQGSVAGTGHAHGCLFKSKVYAQGAEFEDGCNFICTCIDGTTGTYTCNARCITWSFPTGSGCSLRPPPTGMCCSEPSCAAGYTITYPAGYDKTKYWTIGSITDTGKAVSSTGTGAGCKYPKTGGTYKQDETWNDGCDFKCTCVNSAIGEYSCQARCLTWNLPAECSLNPPAAGKCCATPNCPDGYTIQYPPGYKEE